ncbi:MAG: hypothetical protein HQM09_11075 [Candidatus Riflebacteria bacterium]|nr:hypothetical protein [Candidatus Riflebacteria bacterium]
MVIRSAYIATLMTVFTCVALSGATASLPKGDIAINETGSDVARWYHDIEKESFQRPDVVDLSSTDAHAALSKASDETALDKLLSKPVSLEQIFAIAFARFPRLLAARQTVQVRAKMFPQSMYVDELATRLRAFTQDIDTRTTGGAMREASPEMLFPGPGVLSFNGLLARIEVNMAELEYEAELRNTAADLLERSAEKRYLRHLFDIQHETLAVLRSFESTLKTGFTTDRATFQDLAMVQSELARLDTEQASLHRREIALNAEINRFLGRSSDNTLHRDISPESTTLPEIRLPAIPGHMDATAFIADALRNRQEIAIQREQIRSMETLISLKRRQVVSPIAPGFAYAKRGMSALSDSESGMESKSGTNGRGTVPPEGKSGFSARPPFALIPDYGIEVSYLQELEAKLVAGRTTLSDIESSTRAEIIGIVAEFESNRQTSATEIGKVSPVLKTAVESAASAYRTGKATFREWRELTLRLLDSEKKVVETEFASYKMIADLWRHTGSCRLKLNGNAEQ